MSWPIPFRLLELLIPSIFAVGFLLFSITLGIRHHLLKKKVKRLCEALNRKSALINQGEDRWQMAVRNFQEELKNRINKEQYRLVESEKFHLKEKKHWEDQEAYLKNQLEKQIQVIKEIKEKWSESQEKLEKQISTQELEIEELRKQLTALNFRV